MKKEDANVSTHGEEFRRNPTVEILVAIQI